MKRFRFSAYVSYVFSVRTKSPSSSRSTPSDFLTALYMEGLKLNTGLNKQEQLGLPINPEPEGEPLPALEKQGPTMLMGCC